ncbi:uncharacterized protein BDR25DRAFT_306803 [Lindgomyces ingoldianus]|uniref:Uncharacterized protein n=1 Tax=Lindgomyces ingoldianus TaxID=673940 RepID=A0ACB6QE67_9PLEO|nr:uncharacterized protein BDR25DRAFT_306803 [Lindgomyces ingoldianus]KAF2465150.1 hypothetical protein BDR25DRAFT_306803 [Lindgomyces ingoldianus]
MAPKAPTTPTRGRGRAKANTDAKVDITARARAGRSRAARPVPDVLAPRSEGVQKPTKRRGRPAKQVKPAENDEAVSPAKKRVGRPSKDTITATPSIPVRRPGRPPKVAQSNAHTAPATTTTRTAKRSPGRPRKSVASATIPRRVDPRVRSKLPARRVPKKVAVAHVSVRTPAKRRGRPPKADKATLATRKTIVTKVAKAAVAKRAPRLRKGFTRLEFESKFSNEMQEYLARLRKEAEAEDDMVAANKEVPQAEQEMQAEEEMQVDEEMQVEEEAQVEEERQVEPENNEEEIQGGQENNEEVIQEEQENNEKEIHEEEIHEEQENNEEEIQEEIQLQEEVQVEMQFARQVDGANDDDLFEDTEMAAQEEMLEGAQEPIAKVSANDFPEDLEVIRIEEEEMTYEVPPEGGALGMDHPLTMFA